MGSTDFIDPYVAPETGVLWNRLVAYAVGRGMNNVRTADATDPLTPRDPDPSSHFCNGRQPRSAG